MPNANKGFVMFEPTRVPRERPCSPLRIAIRAVVISGSAVLTPIISTPMKDALIPQASDISRACMTTEFAAIPRTTSPKIMIAPSFQ